MKISDDQLSVVRCPFCIAMSVANGTGLAPETRARLIRGCEAIVGPRGVISARDELRVYDCDALIFHHRSMPDLVVLPTSTAQVAELVRLSASEGVPFLPRGAGTGLSGGATPSHGGLLIVLTRMTRILNLDIPNRMATVEAGCVNLWLTNAARRHGFFYAPDPASQQACTIGGNVAENAGGPHCLKYGTTTNHVLGATVVLPDGEVVRLGGGIQDAPGYDLLGVFVGSEGTLGLCTEVTVRLMPEPEAVKTILAVFKSIEDASNAVSGIIARGIIPVALEMIDQETIQAVEANAKAGYPLDAGAVLLIELEGLQAEIEIDAVGVEATCREQGCLKVQAAKTEAERALLWKGRKEAAGSFGRIARHYFIQDAVVPRTKLPAVLREIVGIASRHGVRVANVFHAGDGNVHPMICYDEGIPGQPDRAMRANDEIMRCCIQAGGTVTGEHGIGLDKRKYLRLMYTPEDLGAMQRVRRVLDRAGLCNPGKIFPDDEPRAASPEPRAPSPELRAPREHPASRTGVGPRFVQELRGIVGSDHVLEGSDLSGYRLGAATPAAVVFPTNTAGASRVLALAFSEGLAVVPWGGGAHQCIGQPPARYDLALDLGRMNRLLEHEPADMTATVEAGMRLSDLQRQLGGRGQFLPLDPALGDRASLGGILAANLSGPIRCRYGTARDLVLGVRIAHADGTITRAGAKVVKNATAYDMTKLYVGSHGTLGVFLEATLRLYPRPPHAQGWWLPLPDLSRAQDVAIRILGSHLQPSLVEMLDEEARHATDAMGSGAGLFVSFAGAPEALLSQRGGLDAMAREAGASLTPEHDPERTWTRLRDFPWVTGDGSAGRYRASWRGSVLPSDCAKGIQAIRDATTERAETAIAASVANGILRGRFHADTTGDLASSLKSAREALTALGGFLVVLDAPAPVREQVDVWGPSADGLAVMRRLKSSFDPKGILNPGRFVGGI